MSISTYIQYAILHNRTTTEHHLEHHGDVGGDPKFKIEMVKSFKKPLERQCFEGLCISQAKEGTTTMNRKGEWGQNLPPKFSLSEDSKDNQVQHVQNPKIVKKGKRKSNRQNDRQTPELHIEPGGSLPKKARISTSDEALAISTDS